MWTITYGICLSVSERVENLESHKNVCTVAVGVIVWTSPVQLCPNDIWFSYLPMSHIFERVIHVALFTVGAQFWFSSGDNEKLFDEVKRVKPTLFGSVPMVLNMLYDRIHKAMRQSSIKRLLITHAAAAKRHLLDKGFITNKTLWDKIRIHFKNSAHKDLMIRL